MKAEHKKRLDALEGSTIAKHSGKAILKLSFMPQCCDYHQYGIDEGARVKQKIRLCSKTGSPLADSSKCESCIHANKSKLDLIDHGFHKQLFDMPDLIENLKAFKIKPRRPQRLKRR